MIEPTEETALEDMTKAELLAYAKERGIDGVNSSMLKADIYKAIKEAENNVG